MTKIDMLHAAYREHSKLWSTFRIIVAVRNHFIISAGIAVSSSVLPVLVFRFKTQDVLLIEAGHVPGESDAAGSWGANLYSSILNVKAVRLLAVFTLIYIGIEGGWCIRVRDLLLMVYQVGLLHLSSMKEKVKRARDTSHLVP
ncbi:hypothetical protein ARMSODRAFT_1011663 [Armillaria solidipes]|uniref:Uncharacterized protein n=1 Tax=Armillaria solidipes TaxID=1076256 RepID=A0A2H3CAZ4_9AGAR|nr:hypothetical protein ARMSODRAFT_1011663 [Armillaria solidipes]